MATHGGPATDTLIGQTIGNYLVTQKLGEGGMGSVYLAEHPAIGKKVALKVLHSEFSSNQDVTKRFFNEAKAVNDIGHPNIVDIVDYGILQPGAMGPRQLVYFIMEYIAGGTLSQLVRAESPLPPERALAIAMQVADALAASHKCGIVHRDLKPDNILLIQRHRERDFVKLLDFGIAKLSNDSSSNTRTGIVMGTPAYMSPEQCEGRGNIDHRTDVYALGIVLYEMLTGRVPFIGEAYGEILIQHLTQVPVPPSQFNMMNPYVEAVIMKALEKRPDLRYPTMDEMMRAMADPVGYVEAQGGITGFMQRQLMPSTAPLPPVRMTPSPITGVGYVPTPAPGSITGLPPGPGLHAGAVPTTLGASAGEVQRPRSKTGFVVAGVVVVAAAVAGILVVMGGGKKPAPEDPIAVASGSVDTLVADASIGGGAVTVADAPSAAPVVDASSAVAMVVDAGDLKLTVDAGPGSAATVDPGSGGPVTAEPVLVMYKLTTNPSDARILIDGKDTGKRTPATLELRAGRRAKVSFVTGRFTGALSLDGKGGARELTLKQSGGTSRDPAPGSGKGSNDSGLMRPE